MLLAKFAMSAKTAIERHSSPKLFPPTVVRSHICEALAAPACAQLLSLPQPSTYWYTTPPFRLTWERPWIPLNRLESVSAFARLCARCSSGTNHGQTIDKIMQVNLKAPFFLTKARLATLCCWKPSAHWLPWCLASRKRFLTCVRVGMFS